ncbi:MAG: amino acid racemase [Alphaproteobacteria bacterium]|nr:amino acid racemase [Alphaproteobacteria bacterium]
MSRIVGVLGGMGPVATTVFMSRVQALTPARGDAEHLHLLVDCNPRVPGLGVAGEPGGDTGETLAAMARGLARQGAQLLVMPCNTAHAWAGAITSAVDLPFLNLIEAVADAAMAERPARVRLLAADGCLRAGLYQTAFAARGVAVETPTPAGQGALMDLIHRIKAGDVGPTARRAMQEQAEDLIARGADAVIAGCTEVPLALSPADVAVPLIDSIEALAARTVAAAMA